ncbi:MerR family transcriptional regulator [Nocardia sp. NPDC024068]|uniref:MerR family transcriptional regulator n=1 Tax=Nocardia sp. NPDC024068 TaxID=3157197 RepID=UPI003404AF78
METFSVFDHDQGAGSRNSVVLRTAEVARLSGYSVQQVRNLERDGVLPPVPRTASGYRVYRRSHVWAARAYRALAAGTDPMEAKTIMRAVRSDEPARLPALFDAAHARLDRERRETAGARAAARAIAGEPVGDVRAADTMTISELAQALGVRTSTLRHWDAVGLVVARRAAPGRARHYLPGDVRLARLVRALRQAGYGIETLRELIPRLAGAHAWADIEAALTARDAGIDARSRALLEAAAALAVLLGPAR